MKYGCTLPSVGSSASPEGLTRLARAAEALGMDSIWVSDHVVTPARVDSAYPYTADGVYQTKPTSPYYECLTTLAYLAGITSRVRLGSWVLILPPRNPVLMAKMISTLDMLSGGRVDLGIGVGWNKEEFEALRSDAYERRGAVTDEWVWLMKALWTEDAPSFDGEFYKFDAIGAHPHPAQKPHPPIWIGGHTKPALRRTGQLGDGWLPIGAASQAELPPADVAAKMETIRAEAAAVGRDPAAIEVCFTTSIFLSDTATGRAPDAGRTTGFDGNADEIAATIRAYQRVGVERFVFGFGGGQIGEIEERMRRFAEDVWPLANASVSR